MAEMTRAPRHGSLSRRVLKVMSIFSGVQIINILCSIARAKLVAVWLGPAGIGLFGIYNSVLETASSISQLGTGTGMVRAVARAPRRLLPQLVAASRRWGMALGLTAAIAMMCLSPWLSRITFGDESHILPFVILSAGVLLITISNTESALFQGLRLYSPLARRNVAASLVGLAVTAPMFWLWGLDSIIPALLAFVIVRWVCIGLYRARVEKPQPPLTVRDTFTTGKEFAVLGIFITITTFATNAVSYIFMSYLNRKAGMDTAGYYQAGFTLVNRYAGIILAAIGMEYLPRLSQVSTHPHRTALFLSHEVLLITLVLFPAVTIFVCADTLIVKLLYDSTFLTILPFVTWAAVGTLLRAWSWCLGYVILSRGDGVAYLLTELISALAAIGLNILCYDAMGIAGLGVAYIAWYAIYMLEVWIVCRVRYAITMSAGAFAMPLLAFGVAGATALCRSLGGWEAAVPWALLSVIVSFSGMRRLTGISPLQLIKKFADKREKR